MPASAQLPPGYGAFCDVPIVLKPIRQIAAAAQDRHGKPVIYLDPGAARGWSHFQVFVLAHECGHIKLGHSSHFGLFSRQWATRGQEFSADCWAANALRPLWRSGEILAVVAQFQADGTARRAGYPSGAERAANLSRCVAGQALAAKARTPRRGDTRIQLVAAAAIDRHAAPSAPTLPAWVTDNGDPED